MKKKPGPKPDPEYGYRQRLCGYPRGPVVSARTNRIVSLWGSLYRLPPGRIIDAVLDYAATAPDFLLPLTGQRRPKAHAGLSHARGSPAEVRRLASLAYTDGDGAL